MDLLRFETLDGPTNRPTLKMVKSARLYHLECGDFLPLNKPIMQESMRDLFKLLYDQNCSCFVDREDVFITSKQIEVPQGFKRVDLGELGLEFDNRVVREAFLDVLANEILPQISPVEATELSVAFLIDFDKLLSLKIENRNASRSMRNFNFRTLRHRIITRALTPDEIQLIIARKPELLQFLKIFQSF